MLGVSTTIEETQIEQIVILVEVIEELLNGQDDLTKMQRELVAQVLIEVLEVLESIQTKFSMK